MGLFEEYTDPRLVALYDTVCPWGEDTDFYLNLASGLNAATVVDVGCGTGLLACELARRGHAVTGVDPSPTMLEVARTRPGGDRVCWIEGTASMLPESSADLALMTGHVVQVIVDDEVFRATLEGISTAVRRGGHVAFESRAASAQVWATRSDYLAPRRFMDPVAGPFRMWQEATEVDGDTVRYELHYVFDDGTELVSKTELRFRSQAQLTSVLSDVGFSVKHVFGDWVRNPVGPESRELIFVATCSAHIR